MVNRYYEQSTNHQIYAHTAFDNDLDDLSGSCSAYTAAGQARTYPIDAAPEATDRRREADKALNKRDFAPAATAYGDIFGIAYKDTAYVDPLYVLDVLGCS